MAFFFRASSLSLLLVLSLVHVHVFFGFVLLCRDAQMVFARVAGREVDLGRKRMGYAFRILSSVARGVHVHPVSVWFAADDSPLTCSRLSFRFCKLTVETPS